MPDQTTEQRLLALETGLATVATLVDDLVNEIAAQIQAQTDFQTSLQATLGPLIRQIQAENGLLQRASTTEATLHSVQTRLTDLESFDAHQKRGPSTADLANQVADLKLTLQRLQTADKYALTREKLGRLMLANNLITNEELPE